jgi:hypothetical protein
LAILNPFAVAHRYLDQATEHVTLGEVDDMLATIERWTNARLA